ncbi:Arginine ABC transporter permease protein ArtM [Candidatus Bartonella washoeensis]|uniref:His/Glu/Gln/Arg/opine family amino ABC transporter, permease, 3-TM region n=2 Tax=Candidatus Bartonella washoeensis TaxID=186739 RepID=J0QRA1_9HYPH|nr:ABC transporter permease subunit [Bartonella washoeensis]EJF81721.1 His/Glu/Gln/Arg/opine family amino ABC transporter, permease, 3-TM region [Bartonella washoeensis Sb944nv]EJF85579.1 His/Glu/Gln/Arg/opine family amino ABC transporter, permease, 3-TM region [Bartonella washoeensis 085-0475]SPU27909.1 Arginine ABC transporter permease protein ArtM [Bartonella washoeensis]
MIPEWLYFLFNPALLNRYGPKFIEGFIVTVELVSIACSIGFFLGMLIAFARLSNNKFVRYFAEIYVYFFRGSPLLAQLFLFYYGLGSMNDFWQQVGLWWFFQNAWYCCLFIFALNSAAYQSEIFKGSFLSVTTGQREASKALGLSSSTTFFRVILPQAMVVALRPLGNEVILMIKSSAIASLITVYDLMGIAKLTYSRTFDFQVYVWAALIYLLIVELINRFIIFIEYRLTRYLR